MDNQNIKNLDEIKFQDYLKFGSKAAALGELLSQGFNVPHGYAISVDSFDVFLIHNDFPYQAKDYAAYSKEIRELIDSYTFKPNFLELLQQSLDRLIQDFPDDEIIVRSSVLCEDGKTASMAGIFESFPGLKTIDEVLVAIKKCYSALFSDHVINLYTKGYIQHENLKTGVIIQRYIRGDRSGVTFTSDPVEMNPETIKISSVQGLCNGLTSGSDYVTTYSYEKNSLAVKKIYGDEEILSTEERNQILITAKEIEEKFGYYQDIEWTLLNGHLFILQTRPITNMKDLDSTDDWILEDCYINNEWSLTNDQCYLPLIGELLVMSNNYSGDGAYRYGMDWDSEIFLLKNGYMYRTKREIPNSKERLDKFLKKLNIQFDNGEDEFDKHIKPELSKLVEHMHEQYIDRELSDEELLSYFNEAELFMKRGNELHWRATTSEWYMGHFFRERIKRFYDQISAQDLVDLVYTKTMMSEEREEIYKMVHHIQNRPELSKIFSLFKYDSIIAARLEKMSGPDTHELINMIKSYSNKYGWYYCNSIDDGLIEVGSISTEDCINKIRRYLHIDIDKYHKNIKDIKNNARRLKESGYSRCKTSEDKKSLENAIKAGEKAFLAGDNHAYYICFRKFVYICDFLLKIADRFTSRGFIDTRYDLHYLNIDEIKEILLNGEPVQDLINERKKLYARQKRMLPPKNLGVIQSRDKVSGKEETDDTSKKTIKGETGSKKNVKGHIHIGFPKESLDSDVILYLEHGHEGDLTLILKQVKGIIMKMGTPACHMGIIARELNIPAIYGVGPQGDILKNGDFVLLKGETGEIVILDE